MRLREEKRDEGGMMKGVEREKRGSEEVKRG
jgi:hypothetical protein